MKSIILFAGGPGTFNTDLLLLEMILISSLLILAYGGKAWQWMKHLKWFHKHDLESGE
jgi:hypothetical protein